MLFDPNQYEPSTGAGQQLPISGPEGHVVCIQTSEVKMTQANDGSFLQLDLLVCEGPQAGKVGVERLNIVNKNQTTVDIAMSQLTAICWCAGYMQGFDFMQQAAQPLHNLMFRVVVANETGERGEKGYTKIVKFMSYDGQTPARGKQPPQPRMYGQGGMGMPQQTNPMQQQGMPQQGMPQQQPVQTQPMNQQPMQQQPMNQQPMQQQPQGQGGFNYPQGQQQGVQPTQPQGQPQMPVNQQQPMQQPNQQMPNQQQPNGNMPWAQQGQPPQQ